MQSGSDYAQLLPMIDAVEANLGRRPAQASADAGYCSQDNLTGLEQRNIDAYVATGRAGDAAAGAAKDNSVPESEKIGPPTRLEAMRAKIKACGHDSPYRVIRHAFERRLTVLVNRYLYPRRKASSDRD
jgi:hypothetical protein